MNKLGLFVHFGPYAMTGLHEQALSRFDIPHAEYEEMAMRFDPSEFSAEELVLLAKRAGMEYICFTAKHHDGFCMWDTKCTDYNIMNTPYGRDILGELSEACKKHGILLSIYYSTPDWHHENAYNPLASELHQWKSKHKELSDSDKYIEYVRAQIRELMTGYGKIYTLFWDIPPMIRDESLNKLVRSLQPEILINDRGYDEGDFSTPERTVPEGDRFATMTEACQSVGEQAWGFREDEDYFSVRFIESSIAKVMAMGGSYLLNVGPMANGKLPDAAKKKIETVGVWYNRVKEALCGHIAEPKKIEVSGGAPVIFTSKGKKTYAVFYNGVNSSAVSFRNENLIPKSARLLNNGDKLRIRVAPLPAFLDKSCVASVPHASVADIPCDEINEPIVIELEW